MHYLPEALREAYRRRHEPPMISRVGGAEVLFYNSQYGEPLPPQDDDWTRLQEKLAEQGVDVGIVSINQPGVIGFQKSDASAIARDANDELSDLVRGSGGRTIGLATLPWEEPSEALAELERVAQLGLKGAMLFSSIAGQPVDADKFDPVLDAAATMRLPLLLHPILPISVDSLIEYQVLVPAVGFLFDTTTAALRLISKGVLVKRPALKIILGHSGSLLPALVGRLDREWDRMRERTQLPGRPSDLIRQLYTDTVAGSLPNLRWCIDVFGVDRIMFGSDFPFWKLDEGVALLDTAPLSPQERRAIQADTAMQVFSIASLQADQEGKLTTTDGVA